MPPAHRNDFRWNEWNRAQVEKHGLRVEEVQRVVRFAAHPWPRHYKRRGWEVRGRTSTGRAIIVYYWVGRDDRIFVYHAM